MNHGGWGTRVEPGEPEVSGKPGWSKGNQRWVGNQGGARGTRGEWGTRVEPGEPEVGGEPGWSQGNQRWVGNQGGAR